MLLEEIDSLTKVVTEQDNTYMNLSNSLESMTQRESRLRLAEQTERILKLREDELKKQDGMLKGREAEVKKMMDGVKERESSVERREKEVEEEKLRLGVILFSNQMLSLP